MFHPSPASSDFISVDNANTGLFNCKTPVVGYVAGNSCFMCSMHSILLQQPEGLVVKISCRVITLFHHIFVSFLLLVFGQLSSIDYIMPQFYNTSDLNLCQ